MEIQGKYNKIEIFTDNVDSESLSMIYNMLNIPCFENTKISIMPDVHVGKGCVVGFTMQFNNFVNPSIIGVDIGCGIDAYKLGKQNINFEEFDNFIKNKIPSGRNVHNNINDKITIDDKLSNLINKIVPEEKLRVLNSLGSLGGGNHFIELDKDKNNNIWLVIHSGSRNLGLKVCRYHQQKAKEYIKKKFKGASAFYGFEYMSLDEGGYNYLEDMKVTQQYAIYNRKLMAKKIIQDFFNLKIKDCHSIHSIHNYINFKDNIVRKGAISAHKGENIIIPFNMRDGVLIAKGKGNHNWNYSAPHGAGRLLRRSESKETLSLDEYKNTMNGIYTSCINKHTIDESPMAYKPLEEIIDKITDSVEIIEIIKPIYNFKSCD